MESNGRESNGEEEERVGDKSANSRRKLVESPSPPPSMETSNQTPVDQRQRRAEAYAFEGKIIRLTRADFDRWKSSYHRIPDLHAELTVIDDKFSKNPKIAGGTQDWFGTASGWLASKHEKILAAEAAVKQPSQPNGDATADPSRPDDQDRHQGKTYGHWRLLCRNLIDKGLKTWIEAPDGPLPWLANSRCPMSVVNEYRVELKSRRDEWAALREQAASAPGGPAK